MLTTKANAAPLSMFDGPSQGLSVVPGHPVHWQCWEDVEQQPCVYEDLDTGEAWVAGDVLAATWEYPHWRPYEQPPWTRAQATRLAMGAMKRAVPLYVSPGPSGYPLPVTTLAALIEAGDLDGAARAAAQAPVWAHEGGYSVEYGAWLVVVGALRLLCAAEVNLPYEAGNVWCQSIRLHHQAAFDATFQGVYDGGAMSAADKADRIERRAMLQNADA